MADKRDSYPIKTFEMEKKVMLKLWEKHPPYALLFYLITGTGAPLPYLLPLSVRDILLSQELTFTLRSDSERIIRQEIPFIVQNAIGDYYHDYSDEALDAPAFLSIEGGQVITAGEFRKRLARASMECGLPAPGMNEAGLRKTFLYKKVLAEGTPYGALEFMGWRSIRKLYNYLGVTKLVLKEETGTPTVIYDRDIINTVFRETRELLKETQDEINNKEEFDEYEAPALLALLYDIRKAITTYQNRTPH